MSKHPCAEALTPLTFLARCFLLPWIAVALALATAPASAAVLCGPTTGSARGDAPPGGPDAVPCAHAASRREHGPGL